MSLRNGQQPAAQRPEEKIYRFAVSLTALQPLTDLIVEIDRSYPFVLTHLVGKSTAAYKLNIKDDGGVERFSSPVENDLVVGTGQFPVPVEPPLDYRPGAQLKLYLEDTSNDVNAIVLLLCGYELH